MTVAVIGQGERAEAHAAWFRQAGVDVLRGHASTALPEADLYDLCLDSEGHPARVLGSLLRRRRRAILVGGRAWAHTAEAARLAQAAERGRSTVAVTGGWRLVPAFARLRELASGGILGPLHRVRLQVAASTADLPELLPAGLDLALWLAGDGELAAEPAAAGRFCARAGATRIELAATPADLNGTTWAVAIEAERGLAAGQATFYPGWPGRRCQDQTASLTLGGRSRALALPSADPAAGELAAVLSRLAAGLPWLAVCTLARRAALGALLPADLRKLAGEDAGAS